MTPDAVSYLARVMFDQAVSSARLVSVVSDLNGGGYASLTAGDGARWTIYIDRHAIAYGWADTPADALADWTQRAQATQ
jgi:hypothetical protein